MIIVLIYAHASLKNENNLIPQPVVVWTSRREEVTGQVTEVRNRNIRNLSILKFHFPGFFWPESYATWKNKCFQKIVDLNPTILSINDFRVHLFLLLFNLDIFNQRGFLRGLKKCSIWSRNGHLTKTGNPFKKSAPLSDTLLPTPCWHPGKRPLKIRIRACSTLLIIKKNTSL